MATISISNMRATQARSQIGASASNRAEKTANCVVAVLVATINISDLRATQVRSQIGASASTIAVKSAAVVREIKLVCRCGPLVFPVSAGEYAHVWFFVTPAFISPPVSERRKVLSAEEIFPPEALVRSSARGAFAQTSVLGEELESKAIVSALSAVSRSSTQLRLLT